MRRTVTVTLFVLAFLIGPVAHIDDEPPPAPSTTVTIGG